MPLERNYPVREEGRSQELRDETRSIEPRWRGKAGKCGHGRRKVGIHDEPRFRPRVDPRDTDHERHADTLIVRATFLPVASVLSPAVAVVGGEDDHRVIELTALREG